MTSFKQQMETEIQQHSAFKAMVSDVKLNISFT